MLDYLADKSNAYVVAHADEGQFRNIHNRGNLGYFIGLFVYIFIALFLVLLPRLGQRVSISNSYLRWLIPSRQFIYPVIAMVVLGRIALWCDGAIKDASITALNGNISEFEELFIYYIGLLYILELTGKAFPEPQVRPHQKPITSDDLIRN